MEDLKKYLHALVDGLVSDHEAVEIESIEDDRGTLLTVHVSQKEIGRIIGASGSTAGAIRHLLRAVGSQRNLKVSMKIFDPLHDRESV